MKQMNCVPSVKSVLLECGYCFALFWEEVFSLLVSLHLRLQSFVWFTCTITSYLVH